MTAALLPQVMPRDISLGHCTNCGSTTYVVALPERRADDNGPVALCATCLGARQETRERRARVRGAEQ